MDTLLDLIRDQERLGNREALLWFNGFRSCGLMAVRLRVSVVPIFIDGLYEVYSIHDSWPKPGPVSISIGRPLEILPHTDYADAARRIEDAVRSLSVGIPRVVPDQAVS